MTATFIDAWRTGLFGCACVLGLALSDCIPTPSPAPPTPILPDAGPGTPCEQACVQMSIICSPQLPDCAATMQHIDEAAEVREPSGKPFTCEDILSAQTKAAMQALGVPCP